MGSVVLWPTPSTIPSHGYHHLRDGCSAGGSPSSSSFLFGAAEDYICYWNGFCCNNLKCHSWYIDDGVVARPSQAVKQAIPIIHSQEPPLGLFLNTTKCELFRKSDPSAIPPEMKRSSVPKVMTIFVPIL